MTDYTPIDCQLYSRYELTIMHRQRLRIAWRDGYGQLYLQTLLPTDLVTDQGAEYLVAIDEKSGGDTNRPLRLRLDQILSANAL